MNKKHILALSLASIMTLTVLQGCAPASDDGAVVPAVAPATPVETALVQTGDISTTTSLSGKIVASSEVMVMPPVHGEVEDLRVSVGDTVSENQILFVMNKDDINKEYQPLLDNYNRTNTLATESLRLAQKNVDDTQALFDIGAASQMQLDQVKLALLQTQTQNESQLEGLEDGMEDILDMLADASVKAPISGVITAVNIVEDSMASNANPAIIISETHLPEISVAIPETLLSVVKAGDNAKIVIPAAGNLELSATVDSIAPTTNAQTQMYDVKITLPQSEEYTVGMFCNVTFATNTSVGAVKIPSDSILNDAEGDYVFIVNADKSVTKINITTGLSDGLDTEVLSGLVGGETLVTSGQDYVEDGQMVTVNGEVN